MAISATYPKFFDYKTSKVSLRNLSDFPVVNSFEIIAGDVVSLEIPYTQHLVGSINEVYVYKPNGSPVSVVWRESEKTIYIESNISLLNHRILIT